MFFGNSVIIVVLNNKFNKIKGELYIFLYIGVFFLLLGLVLIGDGMVMTAIHCVNGLTYVDVYEDKFVGKGIQNLNLLDFNIKIEQISNISVQGFWIHIHTNSGVYKIMTDKKTATEVFNYYNELKG